MRFKLRSRALPDVGGFPYPSEADAQGAVKRMGDAPQWLIVADFGGDE